VIRVGGDQEDGIGWVGYLKDVGRWVDGWMGGWVVFACDVYGQFKLASDKQLTGGSRVRCSCYRDLRPPETQLLHLIVIFVAPSTSLYIENKLIGLYIFYFTERLPFLFCIFI